MKLHEIFSQQYVLLETDYGVTNADTSRDQDEYDVRETGHTTLKELA